MAYCGSPQDLFASEDSDSDATVDLSVPRGAEPSHPADVDIAVILSDAESMQKKQNEKPRSRRRPFQHTVSSSDSEDDSRCSACPSFGVNSCASGHRSNDSVRVNDVTVGLSSDINTVRNADTSRRVLCSQQPVTDRSDDRPLCKYGKKCYRKNPGHFQEFRHPGNA